MRNKLFNQETNIKNLLIECAKTCFCGTRQMVVLFSTFYIMLLAELYIICDFSYSLAANATLHVIVAVAFLLSLAGVFVCVAMAYLSNLFALVIDKQSPASRMDFANSK